MVKTKSKKNVVVKYRYKKKPKANKKPPLTAFQKFTNKTVPVLAVGVWGAMREPMSDKLSEVDFLKPVYANELGDEALFRGLLQVVGKTGINSNHLARATLTRCKGYEEGRIGEGLGAIIAKKMKENKSITVGATENNGQLYI